MAGDATGRKGCGPKSNVDATASFTHELSVESTARLLAIAADPRVLAHFAEQRTKIAKMRAELPQALAKEALSLLPPSG